MGTLFRSKQDAVTESQVAKELARAWDCTVRSFGGKDHIDYYALRDGLTVAWIELKARQMPSTRYATVYFAFRKWIALQLATVGTGIPSFFVVRFEDEIRYIDVAAVDARSMTISGNSRKLGWNDIEPIIEVPIASMHVL